MVRNLKELGPNLQKIVTRLMANQNFVKLLYYTDKDPLGHDDITQSVIDDEIDGTLFRIIPRVPPMENANSVVVMRVTSGQRIELNTEFQEIMVQFEVFVPMTQWAIKDANLRPFSIMSEIQQSLDGKIINGIGQMHGGDFELNFVTDEMSCYEVLYRITEYG